MKMIKLSTVTAACAGLLMCGSALVIAEDASPAPNPQVTSSPSAAPSANPSTSGSSGDWRGNFAEMRQRIEDRIKTSLKATDDEWAVIQPLLEKVMEKQRMVMPMRFGRRGGDSGGNNAMQNGAPEADALRTALDSDQTTTEEIKTKLAAWRDARKKAQADLEQAREDLKKVLSLRQEAVLVSMGILE